MTHRIRLGMVGGGPGAFIGAVHRIAARLDLKADRSTGTLRVLAAHAEPEAPADTAPELAAELRLMAGWLGLERVEVSKRGDLAETLAAALAAPS